MPGMIVKSLFFLAVATSTVLASVIPTKFHLVPRGTTSKAGDPNSNVLRPVGLPSFKKRVTNAERFARGLPPSKPNRLFNPTRRQSGGASLLPTSTGVIEVFNSGGALLGYVDGDLDGTYTYTTDEGQALQVAVVIGDSPTANLLAVHGDYTALEFPYVCLDLNSAIGSTYPNIEGCVNSYPPGTGPSYETAIWNVDSTNGNTVTATWINADTTQVACQFVYGEGAFSCTGNAADFISTYGSDSYQEVTFAFLPN